MQNGSVVNGEGKNGVVHAMEGLQQAESDGNMWGDGSTPCGW